MVLSSCWLLCGCDVTFDVGVCDMVEVLDVIAHVESEVDVVLHINI